MPRDRLKIARTHSELLRELREFVKRNPATTDSVIYRLGQRIKTSDLAAVVEEVTGDPSV